MTMPTPQQIETALAAAEQLRDSDQDDQSLGCSLLYLQRRNKVLERLLEAVEHYLNSGHGQHEHVRLIKAVDEARHQAWQEAADRGEDTSSTLGLE